MEQPLSPEEKLAFDKVNESIRFDGERYEVAVPWKHERPELPPKPTDGRETPSHSWEKVNAR